MMMAPHDVHCVIGVGEVNKNPTQTLPHYYYHPPSFVISHDHVLLFPLDHVHLDHVLLSPLDHDEALPKTYTVLELTVSVVSADQQVATGEQMDTA